MKVLLIAYYFPPLSGAGIGRPLSLFKYFPAHGVECDVLTVKPVAYRYFEPDLLNDLDRKRIYRSHSWDPQRLMHMLGMRTVKHSTISKSKKINQRLFPDSKIGWVRPAVSLGRVLVENKKYDAIISTSPPVSTHLIGMKLSEEFNLPWIADFRDFWTSYKIEESFDSQNLIDKGKKLLSKIVTKASEIIVVNNEIAEYLGRGTVIRNSFDQERAKLWRTPIDSKEFTIGVLGTIDSLTPIEPLLNFLEKYREMHPDTFSKIKIIHVGAVNINNLNSLLDQYKLNEKFHSYGHQNRERTIELLNQVSLMYLGIDRSAGKGNTTSRIFDLIASGRPIIASIDKYSEAAALLEDNGNVNILDKADYNRGFDFINDCISRTKDIKSQLDGKHSSENMVMQFIEVINRLK